MFTFILTRRAQHRLQRAIEVGDVRGAHRAMNDIWSRASVVYRGPVGYGAAVHPEHGAMMQFLQLSAADVVPLLEHGVDQPVDMVAAYSIVSLGVLGIRVDPARVSARPARLRWQLGHRAGHATLAELADLSHDPDLRERAHGLPVAVDDHGWGTCPRCRVRFKVSDPGAFRDGVHWRCGQQLVLSQDYRSA